MDALLANAAQEDGGVGITNMQNAAWAQDKTGFGYKMLLKMGWKEKEGLGKDGEGRTEAVKVTKRADARGLGAEKEDSNNHGWTETAQSFTGVLASLKEKYGAVNSKKKAKKEKKREEKKKKRKRSRSSLTSDSSDGEQEEAKKIEVNEQDAEAEASARDAKTKRAKLSSDNSDDSNSNEKRDKAENKKHRGEKKRKNGSKEENKKRTKSRRKKGGASSVSSSAATARYMKAGDGRPGRAKFIKSKLLAGRSAKEMAAVLGVVTRP